MYWVVISKELQGLPAQGRIVCPSSLFIALTWEATKKAIFLVWGALGGGGGVQVGLYFL